MSWNVPSVFTSVMLTSAKMNQIRDSLKAIGDPWTAYTPAWTASTTNPVIGNGTITAAYREVGDTIDYWIEIAMGSTTTYGSGSHSIELPPVVESNHRWSSFLGTGRDTSASVTHPIMGERQTAGVLLLRAWPTTAGDQLRSMSPTVPFTLANTDVLFLAGTLQAA